VLSGSADDAIAADKASKIAAEFSGEEKVINSVNISSSQQVQLNVRFVEINRQVGQELGTQIAAQYTAGNSGIGFNSDPKGSSSTEAGSLIASLLSGGFSIDVAIKALEDRGVARRLAEPNLIARSGQTASFLAGGEFPIPVSEGDNGQISITYKKFGVSLDFTPTVMQDGLIGLDIAPEVSSLDPSSSYKVGDISVPGFVVRRAHTSVDLKSGQSFMIAGLLQSQNDTAQQRIPGLGKMPVLGALFSSRAYQRRETDLVMIVTPYLVKPMDPTKKPRTPADGTYPASTSDYFLGSVDETKGARQRCARLCQPRRIGRAGADFRTLPRSAGAMKMAKTILAIAFAASCCGLAGCSETYQRLDGVTPAAGDAMAANTVMQMVDPWQYGVQDTDLNVPADRGDTAAATGEDAGGSSGGSSGGTASGDKGTSTTGSY